MTAEQIKELRERIGITQRQLADYLGVNQATIYRWEAGTTRIGSETHIVLLQILEERFQEGPDGIRARFARGNKVDIRFIGHNCIDTYTTELQPETHTAPAEAGAGLEKGG